MNLVKNSLIVCLLFIAQNSFSQFSEEYYEYKNKYDKSHLVVLNKEIVLNIRNKKGNLEIDKTFLEEKMFLDESAKYKSKGSVVYSHFYEVSDIEASSYIFNTKRNKYDEIKVEDFKEKDEMTNFFHDDTKSINFIYPNLSNGGKSKLSYSEKIKNPRFLSPFYFGDSDPIINNKISVIIDKGVVVDFKKMNFTDEDLKYTKTEKGGRTIHTWQLINKDQYDYEANSPSYKKILPHIIPIIKSYSYKGEEKPLLNDVSDLYNWYYSIIKDTNKKEADESLKKQVEALTKDKTTELEKVKSIYYWVQQNIKYIAFEYALGGFIPREANDVFNKKYGDCKDNSSILQEMLEIANIEGNITWIGTRSIPYTYQEIPTPIVDNHMILSYENNGKTYFLDATGRYNDLGIPTSFIQGKEALIAKGDNKFVVKKVPVMDHTVSSITDNTSMFIEDDRVIGNSNVTLKGYYKGNYFNYLEDKKTKEEINSFYNKQLSKGNNSFLIEDLEEINKFSYDKDFSLKYKFSIKNYAKSIEDEVYVNLNLSKPLSYYKKEKDRKNGVEYKFQTSLYSNISLKLPEGYVVKYLPKNVSFKNELFSFKIAYVKEAEHIKYHQTLEAYFIDLTIEQQKELNTQIKKLEKNYKEIIVLKKK